MVDRRRQALDLARSLGAHTTVEAGDDSAAEIMDATGGLGADVTIDLVGADATLALAAAVTRSLGHLTIVGLGGGTLPIGFFSIAYELSVATTYWGTLPELLEVIALAAAGRICPDVQRFTLAEAPAAYDLMRRGELEGRAVVVPN